MAFKEEIAKNLTQGGVKNDIDWMDMLALALPAVVSKDPEAPTRAMQFWQMGRQMREAREKQRREELGQQQYARMVGEYINNMQQQAALAQKRGIIENMPSTVTRVEPGYGTDETGQFDPGAEMGVAPTVEVSNQEKLRQLSEWDKEASKLNNSFDAAALTQKYPDAPPNLVATLMMEHFKMKRAEANEQIKASKALALEERKHKQAIELKNIESANKIAEEKFKSGLPTKPKEPTPRMYEDIPIGNGRLIQTYKWNPETQSNDIPVGKPKPAWKPTEGGGGGPQYKPNKVILTSPDGKSRKVIDKNDNSYETYIETGWTPYAVAKQENPIDKIINASLERASQRMQQKNGGTSGSSANQPSQKTQATQPKTIKQTFTTKPKASLFTGKTMTDTVTGKKYISNGSEWREIY